MDANLVGIAGTFASGKDTLANYLAGSLDYQHVSTGDIVREELIKKGLETNRDNLVREANDLRRRYGGGVLVEMALDRRESPRLAVSGIRALGEAAMIIVNDGMMVFVDAPARDRYERLRVRGRIDDEVTYEDFVKQEERELVSNVSSHQNIEGVRSMAYAELINDGTEQELFVAFRGLLAQL